MCDEIIEAHDECPSDVTIKSQDSGDTRDDSLQTSSKSSKMAGRKAAKSLRLFRGSVAGDENVESSRHPQETHELERIKNREMNIELTNPCTLPKLQFNKQIVAGKELSLDHPVSPMGTRRNTSKYNAQLFLSPQTSTQATQNQSNDQSRQETTESPHREAFVEDDNMPIIEPVSSAIYFPHAPANVTVETTPEHLTAAAEFDHLEEEMVEEIPPNLDSDPGSNQQDKNNRTIPVCRKLDFNERKKSCIQDTAEENEVFEKPGKGGDTVHVDELTTDESGQPNDDTKYSLAVELQPFKNKVGGHTAIFKFSHRAVCKALVNRENTWYENIEILHPELLKYMPKYIGVLNVRYSTILEDETCENSEDPKLHGGSTSKLEESHESVEVKPKLDRCYSDNVSFPEVVLEDNIHIVPQSLWGHYSSSSPGEDSYADNRSKLTSSGTVPGSTSVNTKLKELVLSEVFAPIRDYTQKARAKRHSHYRRSRDSTSRSSISSNPQNIQLTNMPSGHTQRPRFHRYSTSSISTPSSLKHLGIHHFSIADCQPISENLGTFSGNNDANVTVEPSSVQSDDLKLHQKFRSDSTTDIEHDSVQFPDRETFISNLKKLSLETSRENAIDDDLDDGISPTDNMNESVIFDMENDDSTARNNGNEDSGSQDNNKERPENRLRKHTRFERFILLEDLTSGMKYPCVLDLKMGTRQYGTEARKSKQESQRKKCHSTTSKQLGTRICGMQVWDTKKQSFINRDKYFGRKVTVGYEFFRSLSRFLYDGNSIYSIVKHIPKLVDGIRELVEIIEKLVDYRLYGSSILLMYDSEKDQASRHESTIILRLIDFAQSVIGGMELSPNTTIPPYHKGEPDLGYIKGLKSLIYYFSTMFKEFTHGYEYKGFEDAWTVIRELDARHELDYSCEWLDDFSNEELSCPFRFQPIPPLDSIYENASA